MALSMTKKGTTGTTPQAAIVSFPAVEGKSAHLVNFTGYGTAGTDKITAYAMSAYSPAATIKAASTSFTIDDSTNFTDETRIIVQNANATLPGHVFTRLIKVAPATTNVLSFDKPLTAADQVTLDDKVYEMGTTLGDIYLKGLLQLVAVGNTDVIFAAPAGSPMMLVPNTPSTSRIDSAMVVYR